MRDAEIAARRSPLQIAMLSKNLSEGLKRWRGIADWLSEIPVRLYTLRLVRDLRLPRWRRAVRGVGVAKHFVMGVRDRVRPVRLRQHPGGLVAPPGVLERAGVSPQALGAVVGVGEPKGLRVAVSQRIYKGFRVCPSAESTSVALSAGNVRVVINVLAHAKLLACMCLWDLPRGFPLFARACHLGSPAKLFAPTTRGMLFRSPGLPCATALGHPRTGPSASCVPTNSGSPSPAAPARRCTSSPSPTGPPWPSWRSRRSSWDVAASTRMCGTNDVASSFFPRTRCLPEGAAG